MADEKDTVTQAQVAQAGKPEPMPEIVEEAVSVPVPKDLLDRRQRALSERRRPGGPPLVETGLEAAEPPLPDQPTATEPPKGGAGN